MARPSLLWLFPDQFEKIDGVADILTSFAEVDVRDIERPEIMECLGDYEILIPQLRHEINREVIDCGKRLRMIATPSTGTDHIDVKYMAQRGLELVCIKEDREFLDRVQSTAELAWLLILAANRNLRAATRHIEGGQWQAMAVRGHELIDRTLGIIGYGRLGTMVSRFAHATRMNVVATDPQPIQDEWVTQLPLDQLLAQSDIITIHVHLMDETRGMIGRDQISKMKKGAFLVNTSRGGIIDEDALIAALRDGHLAGAGLDVIQGERDPNRNDRPLMHYFRENDNLILTPHYGGATFESQAKAFVFTANKIKEKWAQIALGNS